MEERIIDDEYGRGIRLKKTKDGYVDVTDELAEELPDDEEGGEELAFEFPEMEEDDEDLVGLSPEEAAALRKKKQEEEEARKTGARRYNTGTYEDEECVVTSDEEIARVLSSGATLDMMAGSLIEKALDAGGRDNVTLVLCREEEG